MKKKSYTMKDVALIAGVTQPTVSHVINGTASISKEVCERVNRVIEELNYRPNALAKGLKTNKTNIVGLIIPDIGNGYYGMVARAVESMLARRGYASFLACTEYNKAAEKNYLDNLLQYNVEGIIIAYQYADRDSIAKLIRINKPFVSLDDELMQNESYAVQADHFAGGYYATRHLLARGRKRVAFVSEPLISESIKERLDGYKKAHMDMGVVIDEALILTAKTVYDKFLMGMELGHKIAERNPDGIFSSSDVVACGIMRALSEAGKKVPDDIALIGYDDIPMARIVTPALSTVAQPVNKMVEIGIGKLIALMQGENIQHYEKLKPKLIIRETT